MTLLHVYQSKLAQGEYQPDEGQLEVIAQLEELYQRYRIHSKASPFYKHIWKKVYKTSLQNLPFYGAYIWGDVGAGKTSLMDCFYESLPTDKKMRIHFHAFMKNVHEALTKLQGLENPLPYFAQQLAKKIQVLCLDEFFIKDIADAMILRNLLIAIFEKGIFIVLTSNTQPNHLYENGLQRTLFIPAIEYMQKHMKVLHLKAKKDYRLKNFESMPYYYFPINCKNQQALEAYFQHLKKAEKVQDNTDIWIEDRSIKSIKCTDQLAWFDFSILCSIPRSPFDYMYLAQKFKVIFLSNVTKILAHEESKICYLIYLIDILYDAKVKLILLAEVPLDDLYTQGRFISDFQRAYSRIIEMQTVAYWKNTPL